MTWADAFAWINDPWWLPVAALALAVAGAAAVTWWTARDPRVEPEGDPEAGPGAGPDWEEEEEWFI